MRFDFRLSESSEREISKLSNPIVFGLQNTTCPFDANYLTDVQDADDARPESRDIVMSTVVAKRHPALKFILI